MDVQVRPCELLVVPERKVAHSRLEKIAYKLYKLLIFNNNLRIYHLK